MMLVAAIGSLEVPRYRTANCWSSMILEWSHRVVTSVVKRPPGMLRYCHEVNGSSQVESGQYAAGDDEFAHAARTHGLVEKLEITDPTFDSALPAI